MKLKVYLAECDMKVNELAQIMEIDRSYLSCIMNGRKRPGRKLIKKFREITNEKVTAEDFKPRTRMTLTELADSYR
jgi:transcriptional regulator with XRE-family HTH domain